MQLCVLFLSLALTRGSACVGTPRRSTSGSTPDSTSSTVDDASEDAEDVPPVRIFYLALDGEDTETDEDMARSAESPERIIGGDPVNITAYPFQVMMELNNVFICGGSILTASWVLSAAHCTHRIVKSDVVVIRAGTSLRSQGGETRRVRKVITHPAFGERTMDFDVSLLGLEKPFELSESIKPIRMVARGESTVDGEMTTVSGWGRMDASVKGGSEVLQAVEVPVVDLFKCRRAYRFVLYVSRRMLCAGVGGKDSCLGDSGGPLVKTKDGEVVQVGVVSWGKRCAEPEYPGVYANLAVTELNRFIQRAVEGAYD